MGYKTPLGINNYSPARFSEIFLEQKYSPPAIVRSREDILRSIERAREAFSRKKVKIRQGSSLDQLFSNASSRLKGKKHVNALAEIDNKFVAFFSGIIIAVEDEPGIKGIFEIIAGSDMTTSSRSQSRGKDMLWELTMLTYLRIAAIPSKIAEPDIVTNFGFGDYGMACKKIYSENSVEKAIKKGITQLRNSNLRGAIALNLDDLFTPPNRLPYASSQDFFRHMLSDYIEKFLLRHENVLKRFAPSDVCDGYIVYLSATGYIMDKRSILPVAVKLIYDASEVASEHNRRLLALGEKFGNSDGLADWVKKVGGTTENW